MLTKKNKQEYSWIWKQLPLISNKNETLSFNGCVKQPENIPDILNFCVDKKLKLGPIGGEAYQSILILEREFGEESRKLPRTLKGENIFAPYKRDGIQGEWLIKTSF